MKKAHLFTLALTLAACGCATAGLTSDARRLLRATTAATFALDAARAQDTLAILTLVEKSLSRGERVVDIHFWSQTRATVYFSAPKGSMHGGPFANAEREGQEWKLREKWFLSKRPNQSLEPTHVLVTLAACAASAPSTRVAHL